MAGDRLPKANVALQKTDNNLADYAQAIHDGMGSTQGLLNFPAPPVDLAEFQTIINNYRTAITNAIDLGKKNVTAKNAARVLLENEMRILARYVTQTGQAAIPNTYDNIRAFIAVSGFEVSVIPTPVGDIPSPTLKLVQSQAKGSLRFILQFFEATKGVKSVVVQYRKLGDTTFQTAVFSSTRAILTGLESGVTYQVRFYGVGAVGTAINFSTLDNYVIL